MTNPTSGSSSVPGPATKNTHGDASSVVRPVAPTGLDDLADAGQARVKILHDAHIGDVAGIAAVGVAAGIKRRKKDIALLRSTEGTTCAGVYTQNKVVAAPVTLSRRVTERGRARAIVCVAGNANAVTGEQGDKDALRMQQLTAETLGVPADEVLVASTGVIGELMPMDKVEAGIRDAASAIGTVGSDASCAEAILTTDTRTKELVLQVDTEHGSFRIGGISKGSGMIEPNMATMLGFVVTDLAVDAKTLDAAQRASCDRSFNMISVDKETSTNDMALVLANGESGLTVGKDVPLETFRAALDAVNLHLAKEIARDGEGATKLLTVQVRGAADDKDARLAAKAIVNSPLVKTAIHGEDPNWGRILAAVGYSGAAVETDKVHLHLGHPKETIKLLSDGEPLAFDRAHAQRLLGTDEIVVDIDLGLGDAVAVAYGCDLTREYIDINAHYHT